MSDVKHPRLPVVGEYVRQHGRLVEIQDVTPKPILPVLDYVFESTEARVEIRATNRRVIDQRCTINDFYGEGTCVAGAIEDAKKYAEEFPGVVVAVVKVTSRVRKRPSASEHKNYSAPEFREFRQETYGCKVGMPDDVEETVWTSDGRLEKREA